MPTASLRLVSAHRVPAGQGVGDVPMMPGLISGRRFLKGRWPPAGSRTAGLRARRTRSDSRCGEVALDLRDELLVQVEEPTEEVDHEAQVLLPVRQVGGAALGVVETPAKVGDILA